MPALTDLLGSSAKSAVADWLDLEISRCADPAWLALWSEVHVLLPHVAASDFAHRCIKIGGAEILAGIRFYGGDLDRPFVDIRAWTGDMDWTETRRAVRQEWTNFHPRHLRILTETAPTCSGFSIDQTIHAGRIGEMAGHTAHPDVTLEPCYDPALAAESVADWYADLAMEAPKIAAEVQPCAEPDLTICRANGTLHWVNIEGRRAGLIATQPGQIDMIRGHVVHEIVLDRDYRGLAFSKFIQQRLAATMLQSRPASDLLIGTIHRVNTPSCKSATAAGRPDRLRYMFLGL